MSCVPFFESVSEMLGKFEAISLGELDAVALQKRKDRKFIFHQEQLIPLLDALCSGYKVLEIDQHRIHRYETTYFDTDNFQMYLDHHNEKLNRFKIRHRKYEVTGSQFLEVKFKNNKRDTIKKRKALKDESVIFASGHEEFISANCPFSMNQLRSALNNTFYRMNFYR